MTTALAAVGPTSIVRPGTALAVFTPEDREIIKNSICPDASDAELNYFLSVAGALGMNPLTREIHLLITENKDRSGRVISRKVNVHTGIDGLRKRAIASGRIVGIVGPEYANAAGQWSQVMPDIASLVAARVKVYLAGWDFPIEVVAHWQEFGQPNARYYDDGNPRNNWARMPRWMLGKIALSNALRSACPDQLGGLYATEELSVEDVGGFSVTVTDEKGEKKTRAVPRPGNAPPPVVASTEPDAIEAEVSAPTVDAGPPVAPTAPPVDEEREALCASIKELLPMVFPAPNTPPDNIDWPGVMDYCRAFDGAGKLGRKYPMFRDAWSTEQLERFVKAISDEWARRQLEPQPESADDQVEEKSPPAATATQTRESYEEQQAAAALGGTEAPEPSF